MVEKHFSGTDPDVHFQDASTDYEQHNLNIYREDKNLSSPFKVFFLECGKTHLRFTTLNKNTVTIKLPVAVRILIAP